jgi:multidrug efflux pump subunit AcrA (membrane-fusion protein)
MRKILFRLLLVLLVAGSGWLAWGVFKSIPSGQQEIATARVRRGDVVVRSYARGELRAARSATMIAPNLFGTVQVTRLAPLGAFAHAKDLVVEFDDSEVRSRLEEKELELSQIDEQIKKAQADLAISENQDQVDLLTARYGVRRAELEVKRNELLAAIDAKRNLLALDEARRRLKQLESDVQSRREQAKAQIAVLQEKKNKALIELSREKHRLAQTKVLAPISGLVAIKQNQPNFFFSGMQIPDIREGDQLNAGQPVADILDLSEMEVVARVGELDRANLKDNQEASVQLDAIAGKPLRATIKSMSGTATSNVFSSDPAKKFDITFALDMKQLFTVLNVKPEDIQRILAVGEQNSHKPAASAPVPPNPGKAAAPRAPGGPPPSADGEFSEKDLDAAKLPPPPEENSQFAVLLRPGLLADVEIIVDKVPNAISIPNQAVFEKDGKLIAWVKHGREWEARQFTPLKRSESVMVVLKGLTAGEEVALADPTTANKAAKDKQSKGGALGAFPTGGGK